MPRLFSPGPAQAPAGARGWPCGGNCLHLCAWGISLDAVAADKASVQMLIAAAERNIADAQLQGLSAENQFDAAYRATRPELL